MPQVREVMTSDVATVDPSAGVVDAAKQMIQQEKGPLAVAEGDRPVGMITDRDLVAAVVAEGRDPNALAVQDVQTGELVTVSPDQDAEEARQLMSRHALDRILVLEDDRLVGILSGADIRTA